MKPPNSLCLKLIISVSLILLLSQSVHAQDQKSGYSHVSETIQIESDSWNIIGTLTKPVTNQMVPALILGHTLWGGNRHVYDSLAIVLAQKGLASLRIDLRGHGESINQGKIDRSSTDPKYVFDAWRDIANAHKYLKKVNGIDSTRMGMIGASYSGEAVARSGREYEFAKAYIILSSGLLSPESVIWMNHSEAKWWYIIANDDHTWALQKVNLVERLSDAEITRFESGGHATDLFNTHKELFKKIPEWFLEHL